MLGTPASVAMAYGGRDTRFQEMDVGRAGTIGVNTITSLRGLVQKMVAMERVANVSIEPRRVKTHWRPEGPMRERRAPKRRKPRCAQVVLPPVAVVEAEVQELSEFAFLDGGKQEKVAWTGPTRPMDEIWRDKWTELRYLWERLRDAFKATALVVGISVRSCLTQRFSISITLHTRWLPAAPHNRRREDRTVRAHPVAARGRQNCVDEIHFPALLHARVPELLGCGAV